MATFSYQNTNYDVDKKGFLVDFHSWDEGFAEGVSAELKILDGLTSEHWDVIRFIRETFEDTGKCPLVYETCRMKGLRLKDLRRLIDLSDENKDGKVDVNEFTTMLYSDVPGEEEVDFAIASDDD